MLNKTAAHFFQDFFLIWQKIKLKIQIKII